MSDLSRQWGATVRESASAAKGRLRGVTRQLDDVQKDLQRLSRLLNIIDSGASVGDLVKKRLWDDNPQETLGRILGNLRDELEGVAIDPLNAVWENLDKLSKSL